MKQALFIDLKLKRGQEVLHILWEVELWHRAKNMAVCKKLCHLMRSKVPVLFSASFWYQDAQANFELLSSYVSPASASWVAETLGA